MAQPCFAAESTGDVPVDRAMKEQLRKEIMGDAVPLKVDEEYVIGYRDILFVSIYGEGSMSVGVSGGKADSASLGGTTATAGSVIRGRGTGSEVRMDGRVSLKHIGDVYVVGMTLTQLADYLKKLYSSIYESPSVTTTLIQSNSRQYTIMGQILKPGLYHLDYPLTIVKAVAQAGGFSEWANSEVTLIRQGSAYRGKGDEAKGRTFDFDYDDFLKGKDLQKNLQVQPADVIIVH
ncbi:polysaccharide biosynthesis/export family protein [Desulfogranum mediterraneum]|uniref:polysaccharide biosynthesis/export family protein n=1 Tax=Desulfogranum mediterraneum TaxID=160661 RepID=UPI001ABF4EDC|nr:polysaccharide biosynthesis/export family protein [Desulfogranum mediterraneum]